MAQTQCRGAHHQKFQGTLRRRPSISGPRFPYAFMGLPPVSGINYTKFNLYLQTGPIFVCRNTLAALYMPEIRAGHQGKRYG
jgi:hypothetical protein